MRSPAFALPLLVALALAGCGSRTSRVEAALVKAGLSQHMAGCIAPRLTDRLSDDQLRALAKVPGDGSDSGGTSGMIARVAATGDPDVVEAVSAAVLHCAMR